MINRHIDFHIIKVLTGVIDVRAAKKSVRVSMPAMSFACRPPSSQHHMLWAVVILSHLMAFAHSSFGALPDNMFSKRLTKSERERKRAQRQEAQLIVSRAKERRFTYVVNPPEIPRVVFGSSLERETLPRTGPSLTSFMRRHQGEVRDYPGPFEYSHKRRPCKRRPPKVGTSSFASKLPRLEPTRMSGYPPLGTYDIEISKPPKPASKPFGSGVPLTAKPTFLTPGPPTYPYHTSLPKYKQSSAFGSKHIIWPAVAVFCTPTNVAKCTKCGLTPFGDYFHNFSSNLDMCRKCMRREQSVLRNCATDVFVRMQMKQDLQQFAPARYCGFFHNHNGTTAALQIMSSKTLRQKIKTENYLYLYDKR